MRDCLEESIVVWRERQRRNRTSLKRKNEESIPRNISNSVGFAYLLLAGVRLLGKAPREHDSGSKCFILWCFLLGREFARVPSRQRIRRWSTQLAFTVRGNSPLWWCDKSKTITEGRTI